MTTLKKQFWVKQVIVMSTLLFVIILLIATSCENHKITGDPELRGRWVNVNSNTDTIVFSSLDREPVLTLLRGKEWIHGQWVVKSASGSYSYKLSDGLISLHWFASSNSAWPEYPFYVHGDTFTVGNFYDKDRRGSSEEFGRIDL